MGLKGLSPTESAKLEPLHPVTKEKIEGAFLTVHGSDSKRYRAMMAEAARDIASQDAAQDTEASYKKTTERLANLIDEIHGLEEDGKPIKDAVKLLTDYPWLRQQVDGFVMRRSNFLPKA